MTGLHGLQHWLPEMSLPFRDPHWHLRSEIQPSLLMKSTPALHSWSGSETPQTGERLRRRKPGPLHGRGMAGPAPGFRATPCFSVTIFTFIVSFDSQNNPGRAGVILIFQMRPLRPRREKAIFPNEYNTSELVLEQGSLVSLWGSAILTVLKRPHLKQFIRAAAAPWKVLEVDPFWGPTLAPAGSFWPAAPALSP